MIKNYKDKKLVLYLNTGKYKKILIAFNDHGMGDCVMFMPLYNRLKQLFPKVHFNLLCNRGQEYFQLLDLPIDYSRDQYDEIFYIKFPEFNFILYYPQSIGKSKPLMCCFFLLGIPFEPSLLFTWKPTAPVTNDLDIKPNTVGLAFQVTSNPRKGLNLASANIIWLIVKKHGFIPLLVQFEHPLKSDANKKFLFIDNTCRRYLPSIDHVVEAISKCKGFIGVNTGTFCMATSMMNGKTLHLLTRYNFAPYYKRFNPVLLMDCRGSMDITILDNYLEEL